MMSTSDCKLTNWLKQKFKIKSQAELYLAKSIDRADFSFREKVLQQKGLL